VVVGIRDRDRGLWLQDDNTTWGSFNQMPAEPSPPDATSTTWTLEVHLDNGNYSLAARAFDYGGTWVDIVPRHFVITADVMHRRSAPTSFLEQSSSALFS
jgi:hypothetical protein